MKQIISFSLTDEAVKVLDAVSKAVGKSRSEYLNSILIDFYTPEMKAKIAEISKLQDKLATSQLKGESK